MLETIYRQITFVYMICYGVFRSSCPKVFCKKGVLRNFVKFNGKHLCQSLRPKACNFIKNESLVQVFSCEFWEISKSTFSYRTPLVAAFAATTTVVLILFVYEVEHFGNGLACNFDLSYFETIVVCNC